MAGEKSDIVSLLFGRLEEPWEVKDLPKFPGWAAMFGPGLIWAGLSQGSGELIWWPYFVSKYGTYYLGWLFIFASLQYWINLEIARYTLATGESIYEGFHRLNHLFGWFIFAMVFIVSFWIGGYVGGGASAIAAVFNYWPTPNDAKLAQKIWSEIIIWIIFVIFLLGPVAYKIVEIVESIAALASFFGMLAAAIAAPQVAARAGYYFGALFIPHWPWTDFGTFYDPAAPGHAITWDPADIGLFVTLIAYTGAGGFWNLYYSFWVRDKNAAMAALIGRVTSPLTGEPEAIPGIGVAFTEKDAEEWSMWMKWLWVDNAFGVILNTLTIIITSLLSYGILFPESIVGSEYKLLVTQGEWFGVIWGDAGRIALWMLAFFFLTDTFVTGLDGIARTTASNLYANIPEIREKLDYSKLYYIIVGLFVIISSYQVFTTAPGLLIELTGVGNMLIMCVYTLALVYLNWVYLPNKHPAGKTIRPTIIPLILILISAVFFWYAFALYLQIKYF